MNRTVIPLTDLERRILTAFAEGDTPAQIAERGIAKLDEVNGVLMRRTEMRRQRAIDLLADPDPREMSPLTAPIGKPGGGNHRATVTPAKMAAAPVQHRAALTPSGLVEPPVAEALPPLTAEQLLNDGVDDLTARIRTLVADLAATIAERRIVEARRRWVADLEGALSVARAELETGAST